MESQADLEQWQTELEQIKFGRDPHFATVQCLPSLWTTKQVLTTLSELSQGRPRDNRILDEDTLGIYVTPDRKTVDILTHDEGDEYGCNTDWEILAAQDVCQKLESGAQWKPESGRTYQSITVIFDAAYISTTPHMIAASAGLLRFMVESFKAKRLSCCTAIALTDGRQPFFPQYEQLQEAFGVHVTATYHRLVQDRPTILCSPPNSGNTRLIIKGNADILTRHLFLHDDDVDLELAQNPRVSTQNKLIVCLADSDTAGALENAMKNDSHASHVTQYVKSRMPNCNFRTCIITRENHQIQLPGFLRHIKKTKLNAVLFIEPGIRFVVPFSATVSTVHKHFAVLRNDLPVFDRTVQQVTRKLVKVSQLELTLFATFGLNGNTLNSHSVTILDQDASIFDVPESPLSVSSAWAQDPMTTLFLLASVDPTRPVEQYLTVVAQQVRADPQLTRELLMRLVRRRLITQTRPGFGQEVAYALTEQGLGVLQFFHRSEAPMSLADAMCLYHTSTMQSLSAKSTLAVMRCVLKLELNKFFGDPSSIPKSVMVHPLLSEPWKSMCYKGPLWAALGLLALALGRGADTKNDCPINELGSFKVTATYVRDFKFALKSTCQAVGLPDTCVDSWVSSNLTTSDIRAVEKVLVVSQIDCVAVAEELSQAGPVIEAYDLVAPTRLFLGSYDIMWFKPFPNQEPRVEQGYTTFFIHQPYRFKRSDIPALLKGKLATLVSSSVVNELLLEQEEE